MKKLKIVMLGAHPDATGGISTVVSNWIESGIKSLVDFDYISTLNENAPGHQALKLHQAIKAYFHFVIRCFKPIDIVHIHLSSYISFYRKLIFFTTAKFKQSKVIIHLHGSEFKVFYNSGNKLQKKLISWMFDNCDAIIVLSEEWKRFINKITTNKKIVIIYNGASTNKFRGKIDNGEYIVISFMGRLGKRKGIYDLLEAFKQLTTEYPNAKLLLGGDGEIEKVDDFIKKNNLENSVQLLGWISGERKIEVFRKTDIHVLPSYNEGLPGSILEAMAAGAPIISTPIGGIPEAVIEGKNGYLINPGDILGLKGALEKLCSDKALRERMGKESLALIDNKFNIKTIVNKVFLLYTELKK
ncbi:MAG: glycosyltransferase family 4 protein [Gammaproteobacteria bacterium]|nr:glycosyltransferase family 4 protein [Gammaproteobacteria bacterium]